MTYEILPHTADVGVALEASSREELFAEAARAWAAIVLDHDPPSASGSVPVDVAGEDDAALLAGFLEECLFVWESKGALACGARVFVADHRARGDLLTCGAEGAEGPSIKAVTYHQLSVSRERGRWRARVFFDV
jgi:SHS2 domain-containing protein